MADDSWKTIDGRSSNTIPFNRIRSLSQQRSNLNNTSSTSSSGFDSFKLFIILLFFRRTLQPYERSIRKAKLRLGLLDDRNDYQPLTSESSQMHDELLNQCRGNDFFDTRQTVSRYYYARRNVIQLLKEFLRKNRSILETINSDCYNTLTNSVQVMLDETIPHMYNLMAEYYGEKLGVESRDETQNKLWQIVSKEVNVDELFLIIVALHGTKMRKRLEDIYISQAKIHASSRIAEVRRTYTGDSINSSKLWKSAVKMQLEMYEKGSDFDRVHRKSSPVFEQRKSIRSRYARSEDTNMPLIYPKGRSLSEGLLFMRTKYMPKDPNSTAQ